MKDSQHQFLSLLGQLPARLPAENIAVILCCAPHDVPVLVAAKLLRPLGNPAQNAVKYFSTAEVLELTKDRAWLVRMTNTISQHWHRKNEAKKRRPSCGGPGRAAAVMELPQVVNG
jgi:hypothetical protein